MRHLIVFACITCSILSCRKEQNLQKSFINNLSNATTQKSSGGGGGSTTTAFLQSVLSGSASRLISGNSDSIWVSFTQAAPAGWVLNLKSSDPAIEVPSTYPVTPGLFNVHPPVTSSVVTSYKLVTITVSLGAESKSTTLKLFPRTYNFPPPTLQSPGNGAGFKNRLQVKFTWSDNANAFYHDIQISDNPAFSNPPMLEVYLNDPIWAASYFNGLGVRYWRVRYIDATGNFGPWSSTGRFEIKS